MFECQEATGSYFRFYSPCLKPHPPSLNYFTLCELVNLFKCNKIITKSEHNALSYPLCFSLEKLENYAFN